VSETWYSIVCDRIEELSRDSNYRISCIDHPSINRDHYLPLITQLYPQGFKVYGIFSGTFEEAHKNGEDLVTAINAGTHKEVLRLHEVKRELQLSCRERIERFLLSI